MNTLQSRLAAARKAAGLTQAKSATRLGVRVLSVARWEMRSGKYRPTLAHLEALADLYGVTLGALLDNPPVLGRWARGNVQSTAATVLPLDSLGHPIGPA